MRDVIVVGVLNVTPDSFYDGGKYDDVTAAVERGVQMITDGADIIEIGGQSSLNTALVSADEEQRRVIPTMIALRKQFPSATFSIDTMMSAVAEEGIRNGAAMINDVSAGRRDPRIFSVAADGGARLVLMYSKDVPPTDKSDRRYDDVVREVKDFLAVRIEAAMAAGVAREKIIIDPGLGFFLSADPAYSFQILARLHEFSSLGFPIFLSPSRKSFLAGPEKLLPADRLPGTIAASAIAVLHGATYIRTHDVREVRRACEAAMLMRN